MSEGAAKRIREILNKTGAYKLTGETSADWEVTACGVGIDSCESAISCLLADLFAETASSSRLDEWEKLFRPQPSSAKPEDRRRIVKARLSMNPRHFTADDLPHMLTAAGIYGTALEENGGVRVLVGRRVGISAEQTRKELDEVLPAHLLWQLDESVNWTALDAWTEAFENLDNRELTWEELEALTREQLEQLAKEEK